MDLKQRQAEFNNQFDVWLNGYIESCAQVSTYSGDLLKSQQYSLLSGGKRFRPFLASLVSDLFSTDHSKIINLCLSLEMVHTYSLIHDDLPCMDNDDVRRGKPTNHKVFSEDIALLAGDGLLSDIFLLIADDKSLELKAKIAIIKLFSEKIGSRGMVSGQVFDMKASQGISIEKLKKIHTLKTANLIQTAAIGAALAQGCQDDELHNISEFSYHLGLAFQIQDDVLDHTDKEQDFKSYVNVIGMQKTLEELNAHSLAAQDHLRRLNKNTRALEELVDFNLKRKS